MSHPRVVLASASPRRRQLLGQIGVAFETVPVDLPEIRRPDESPEAFVRRMALEKAGECWRRQAEDRRRPVLGADTVVVLDGEVLGKPAGLQDARRMLCGLSGREHEVLTAVALVDGGTNVRVSASRVRFRPLAEAECLAYCATGEPFDKAGAYAIQGRAAVFVERIEGSYSGVMGLPLFETAELLAAAGIAVFPELPPEASAPR